MLLPALGRAKRAAFHAACISQLRQHGIAHGGYAGDNDNYFPLFGGSPFWDGYGRFISPSLSLQFFSGAGGGPSYFLDYMASRVGTPQPKLAPLFYCPSVSWGPPGYPGYYIMDNPAGLRFNNAFPNGPAGYFFYAGRKMHKSTHSNADTIVRRNDPRELLVTDMLGGSDRDEVGADYIRVSAWNYTGGWTLNPHEGEDCLPHRSHTDNAHQVLADGSVVNFPAREATGTLAWGTVDGAWATTAGSSYDANDTTKAPYIQGKTR